MKRVFSSNVEQVGFDPTTHVLTVVYRTGRVVEYAGVPDNVGNSVVEAPSVGEALHNSIRGKYAFRYV